MLHPHRRHSALLALGVAALGAAIGVTSSSCDALSSLRKAPSVEASSSAKPRPSAPVSALPSSVTPPKKERADRTHRAGRCGECHEKMYDEWQSSPHAKADDSQSFVAMRKQVDGSACDRCHAPLILLKEPPAFAAREAVSCEVCHRIENVTVQAPVPKLALLLAHEVKLGPRCDPREPYFHRARCSPLFLKAELCAGCHQLYQPTADGGQLPVHTEYADFRKSSYASRGKSCQSCHMPGARAEIATGEPERDGVPDHSFLGNGGKLRGSALSTAGTVTWKPTGAEVVLRLKNVGAGHAIPAGSPGRQLVFEVSARGQDGEELARKERVYERRLVDPEGHAAPFYVATRVGLDTRILPGETRRELVSFDLPGIHELRLTLGFRALDPELCRRLGLPEAAPTPVAEATVALGTAKQGSRSLVLKR